MQQSSKLLKVVSILMIVFGSLGLLLGLLGLLGAGILTALESTELYVEPGLAQLAMVASVILLVGAAIQLVAGIVGTKNHNRPENVKTCMVFAVLVILVQLVGNIFGIATDGFSGSTVVNILIGLVIPVLYLLGVLQLKGFAEQTQQQ